MERSRVLVVGSGGREHALAWKLAQSPRAEAVFAAPGSDGIARHATCLPEVPAGDAAALARAVRERAIDLVVIGPEDPLAAGLADRLREAGARVFGPSAAAARLEASKGFARAFMARHGIPHPRFTLHSELAAARADVRARGGRCVVKADGLAAGKGVAVCETLAQAEAALDEMMGAQRFGAAGTRVVVEDVLVGEEASYYAVTDGERVVTLAPAQDHKRILDGDRGENTGGMGAYAPAPVVSEAVEKRVLEEIVHPTLRGMRAEGTPFSGVLFVGLMIDPAGAPHVVEFNVRFGDPETQAIVAQMDGDLLPVLDGAARGRLDPGAAPRGSDVGRVRGARERRLSARVRARQGDPGARGSRAGPRRRRLPRRHEARGRGLRHERRARAGRDRAGPRPRDGARARLHGGRPHRLRGPPAAARHRRARARPVSALSVSEAAARLRAGGLVGYPTETVWGLGADPRNAVALAELRRWKGRDAEKPMAVLVEGLDALLALGAKPTPLAERLAARFWPGPLTLIVDCAGFAAGLASEGGAVGFRCSPHPARARARACRGSAHRDEPESLRGAGLRHAPRSAKRAAGARSRSSRDPIAGGAAPSSVVDARGARPLVLREGAISAAEIARAGEGAARG